MSFFKNTVNKILAHANLQLQRKNDGNQKVRFKQQEYIWNKISILPKVPTIIDIGIGPNGTPALYENFPDARYIFIDPLEECKQAVENLLKVDNVFVAVAVGSTNTTSEINIARKPSRSSFFKRTHSYKSRGVDKRLVPVRRLDDILSGYNLPIPYGVKIDTEGYEMEVIKGAAETLKKSAFVIAEFHFKDAIKYGYTLQDLILLMQKSGFAAYFMLRDGRNVVFIKQD